MDLFIFEMNLSKTRLLILSYQFEVRTKYSKESLREKKFVTLISKKDYDIGCLIFFHFSSLSP